jgi:hypothetical protein
VRPAVTTGGGIPADSAPLTGDFQPSLDVSQRIGANILASATVNTDFAETEVDTRRTNLTRFRCSSPRSEWRAQRPEAALARTFKLWLPDRFQSHVAGFVTHTLNGRHLAFDRVVPPGVQQNAEQAVPATFRRVALAFLLRASDLSPPSLEGEATIAGLSGTLVGFTAPDGRSLKLLLAPTSAHPLALVYSTRIMGSNEPGPDQVWRLEDYRIVDGVRFPFKLTVVDATNELITEVREIQVNPAFTPADFPK